MVTNLQIPSENILAVSFTNKAAMEMRERTKALLKNTNSTGLTLATFHSLGVRILRSEITKLGYSRFFSIYDTSDQLSIVREALRRYKSGKSYDRKQILSKIGLLKNNGISEVDFSSSPFFDHEEPNDLATEYVYHYYQNKLRFYNAIDFDDILFLTLKLFRENNDIARKYSKRFKYIMVDEYQDTNHLQFELILFLTSTHDNLCVVGDDDQAIYSFRGADISNILDFEKNFKKAKVIKLEENYRSTENILNLANRVIKENKKRKPKTLWSRKKTDSIPYLWKMADPEHESQIVIEEIKKAGQSGHPLHEMAILYRSNQQAVPFEDQLRMADIPYTVIGGQKFYEKKEVKDLMAYLMAILNPNDELSLRRILNIPNRGIGNVTLKKYLDESQQNKMSLFSAMEKNPAIDRNREKHIRTFVTLIRKYQGVFKNSPLPEAVARFIDEIDYMSFVEKQYDNAKQIDMRKKDVLSFVESAERFFNFKQKEATLENFVEKVLLQDSQDKKDESDDADAATGVQLLTLHSSKGLEFNTVYLVGVEEELLPHKRTIVQGEDISEERRLCYVGITRARDRLVMSYCCKRKMYGQEITRHKSRFLTGFEEDNMYIEQNREAMDHLTGEEKEQFKKNFFDNLLKSLD